MLKTISLVGKRQDIFLKFVFNKCFTLKIRGVAYTLNVFLILYVPKYWMMILQNVTMKITWDYQFGFVVECPNTFQGSGLLTTI